MEYEKVLAEVRLEAERGQVEKYCIFLDELERVGDVLQERQNLLFPISYQAL